MEQFNLEEYLENLNQKIVTRDGRSVRIICTNRKSENCPIVTLIQDSTDDCEYVYYYTIDGKGVIRGDVSMDLFFAPEKHEGWVNMYKTRSEGVQIGQIYSSKEEAEMGRNDASYISTAKIEWEE